MQRRIVLGVAGVALLAAYQLPTAAAIDLEYKAHAPPYSVGFEHILKVDGDPSTLIDDGGDPSFVTKFNPWRLAPPSLGKLEAFTSISSDVPAPNVGPTDEAHVFSPAGAGLFKIEGVNAPAPGGFYDGEASTFSATGIGPGPGVASRAIWDIEIVSTGEPIGTPVKVDVAAIIQGYLFANMVTHPALPDARATWDVFAEGIPVISGFETLVDGPGSLPFADDNLGAPVTFFKTVGDTFTLEIAYKLEVDGIAPGAISIAEVTGSEVLVFAMVVPEPGTLLLGTVAGAGFLAVALRRRASSPRRAM